MVTFFDDHLIINSHTKQMLKYSDIKEIFNSPPSSSNELFVSFNTITTKSSNQYFGVSRETFKRVLDRNNPFNIYHRNLILEGRCEYEFEDYILKLSRTKIYIKYKWSDLNYEFDLKNYIFKLEKNIFKKQYCIENQNHKIILNQGINSKSYSEEATYQILFSVLKENSA